MYVTATTPGRDSLGLLSAYRRSTRSQRTTGTQVSQFPGHRVGLHAAAGLAITCRSVIAR
jgi:hypothetical protein